MTLGEVLKQMRAERGKWLTQKVLAEAAGVSPGYVGLIESGARGKQPSREVIKGFCTAFDANFAETEALYRAGSLLPPDASFFDGLLATFGEAVDSDPFMTDRQKQMLRDLYEMWHGKGSADKP